MYQKKVISKNVTEKCTFFTFNHVRQTCFAYNFFLVHFFTTFSTDSKSAWNSAFFDTFFDFFIKNFFLGHINTFFKLWSQTRKKRLKKSKNVFSKCVFICILCLYSLFSKKKSNSLYPNGGSIFWKTREIGLPSYNDLSTGAMHKSMLDNFWEAAQGYSWKNNRAGLLLHRR